MVIYYKNHFTEKILHTSKIIKLKNTVNMTKSMHLKIVGAKNTPLKQFQSIYRIFHLMSYKQIIYLKLLKMYLSIKGNLSSNKSKK